MLDEVALTSTRGSLDGDAHWTIQAATREGEVQDHSRVPLAGNTTRLQGLVEPLQDVLRASELLTARPRFLSAFVGLRLGNVEKVPAQPQGIMQAILERGGILPMEIPKIFGAVELDPVEPVLELRGGETLPEGLPCLVGLHDRVDLLRSFQLGDPVALKP